MGSKGIDNEPSTLDIVFTVAKLKARGSEDAAAKAGAFMSAYHKAKNSFILKPIVIRSNLPKDYKEVYFGVEDSFKEDLFSSTAL